MRYFALLFFLCFTAFLNGQTVRVLDAETSEPVSHVAIFNKDMSKNSLSDAEGEADISAFSENEIIFFRHVAHQDFHSTRKQILQRGREIYLQPNENQLNEVVISVSRFAQQKKELAQKVLVFDKKDILKANAQTAADLLQKTGQVFVQKSQLGGGSPMIRGFATNRLLLTVDGVRMNSAIFRGGNLQNVISIDPLAVEDVEVLFGPGSVIYGSDAIGGVMNFYTLSPEFSSKENGSWTGSAYTRYATANEEKTGHVDLSYGLQKWAFLSSLSFSDFGDLRMGSHGPEEYLRPEYVVQRNRADVVVENPNPQVQVPTGYEQYNFLQKVRFQPSPDWDLKLGLLYTTTSDFPRYDRLYREKNGQLRAAEWYYGPQEWLQATFSVNKAGNGKLYDDAKFIAAYQNFQESRNDRDFGAEILFRTKEEVNAWSANMDFEKGFFGSTFFYGLEYVLNNINSEGTEANIVSRETVPGTSRYPNGSSWQSMAAYASWQWKLRPDLNLQAGARYSHILMNAGFDPTIYDFPFKNANLNTGALTGSAGLNWQQNDIFGWRANLSTAFRAPNIDDVGKIFDSEPGAVVVPNPDLQPETAYSAELGSRINFGRLELDLAVYYTYLDDALVRRDFSLDGQTTIDYQGESSRVQAIQNAAFAEVYGLEAGLKMAFSRHLYFTGQVSLVEGEEEQEDGIRAPLRHAAPLFANAHLVWEKQRMRFDVFSEYNAEIAYEDLAPSEQGKAYLYAIDSNGNPYSPEWYTLNLTAQYEIGQHWLATASVENLTDQRYRTYSSGIAAAGRNLILALRYNF